MEAISKLFNAAATVIVASVVHHCVRSSQYRLRFARHRLFAALTVHCGKHSRADVETLPSSHMKQSENVISGCWDVRRMLF